MVTDEQLTKIRQWRLFDKTVAVSDVLCTYLWSKVLYAISSSIVPVVCACVCCVVGLFCVFSAR